MRGVSDALIAVRDKLRGKPEDYSYWSGKSPEWSDGDDSDDDTRQLEGLELKVDLEERMMKSILEKILIQREQAVAAPLILDEEKAEKCVYKRGTIIERERLKAEQQAFEEELKKRRIEEMKKKETKPQIVVVAEEMRKNDGEIIQKNMESKATYIAADVDTDEEEYEAWLARNIARIKREREKRENAAMNMTEEERREWELKQAGKQQPKKRKWRFMHNYFHKGAFLVSQVDDDVIYTQDFSCAPTGEERQHG